MTEQVGKNDDHSVYSESMKEHINKGVNEYYQEWLVNHNYLIPGLNSALVFIPIENTVLPIAFYQESQPSFKPLLALSEQNLDAEQPQVTRFENKENVNSFALLYPVRDKDSQLIAFVAFAIEVKTQPELQRALTILQWSTATLEVVEYQNRLDQLERRQNGVSKRVDILSKVLSEANYNSAAMRLVTELAVLFNCDRVSLGHYKHHRSQLKHLSHNAQFGKKMNLIRTIEQVMDECIDQGRIVSYPSISNTQDDVTLSHQKLSQQQGDACILSIPIYLSGVVVGAIVLEKNSDKLWSQQQAEQCQSVTSLVMPALEDKRLNDRALWRKAFDATCVQLKRLFGPNYLGRKLVVIATVAIAYLLSTSIGIYRLSGEARIESAIQRAVFAPYNGYIEDAMARAGDKVSAGQILVSLDDTDLRLEKLKKLSQQGKLNRQYQEALATRDRARVNIINAQIEQINAELKLVNNQLSRANLLAPYDGLVVSGDLSQRLGSAVNKGEQLLEVAPLNSYRIKMLIKESRIADVALTQTGTLHLSAFPEQAFNFEVSKITPLTESKEGATFFIVEAELLTDLEKLQSGMEGIGKITIDERLLVSIWTREMMEWIRLRIWSWWG